MKTRGKRTNMTPHLRRTELLKVSTTVGKILRVRWRRPPPPRRLLNRLRLNLPNLIRKRFDLRRQIRRRRDAEHQPDGETEVDLDVGGDGGNVGDEG
jgi:hypothetical protein